LKKESFYLNGALLKMSWYTILEESSHRQNFFLAHADMLLIVLNSTFTTNGRVAIGGAVQVDQGRWIERTALGRLPIVKNASISMKTIVIGATLIILESLLVLLRSFFVNPVPVVF